MKGMLTGVGVAFGAGLGLVLGQLVSGGWWAGLLVGAAVGLMVGAVADLRATAGARRPTPRPR